MTLAVEELRKAVRGGMVSYRCRNFHVALSSLAGTLGLEKKILFTPPSRHGHDPEWTNRRVPRGYTASLRAAASRNHSALSLGVRICVLKST